MTTDEKIRLAFEDLEAKIQEMATYPAADDLYEFGVSALNLIQRVFGRDSLHYRHLDDTFESSRDGDPEAPQALVGVFRAARRDYLGGYLFDVRSQLRAEQGDDILEQAKELRGEGQKDLACILAGVALELAIKDLCDRKGLTFGKRSRLDAINIELRKSGVYNESLRKQVSAWISLRNLAAHGEWAEYGDAEVGTLIDGVERFIGQFLSQGTLAQRSEEAPNQPTAPGGWRRR